MRIAIVAKLVVVAALAVGSIAYAAGGKARTVVESFSDDYAFFIDCAEFGDFDFTNDVEGTTKVRVTDVVSKEGELLQTVLHIVFIEADTNSQSGKSLRLSGAVHEVWDYAADTRTLSGKVWLGNEPGEGTFVQDTGRITLTLDTDEPLFVAGPHEAFFAGGIDGPVCAALGD